jgi:hypothetical protein
MAIFCLTTWFQVSKEFTDGESEPVPGASDNALMSESCRRWIAGVRAENSLQTYEVNLTVRLRGMHQMKQLLPFPALVYPHHSPILEGLGCLYTLRKPEFSEVAATPQAKPAFQPCLPPFGAGSSCRGRGSDNCGNPGGHPSAPATHTLFPLLPAQSLQPPQTGPAGREGAENVSGGFRYRLPVLLTISIN